MSPSPSRFPRVRWPFEMLPILTALVVGGGQMLVLRSHLDLLAPIVAEVPARGGNTGRFWGLTRGIGVVVAGGLLVLAPGWAGLGFITEGPGVVVGLLLWAAGWVLVRFQRLGFHDHPHVHPTPATSTSTPTWERTRPTITPGLAHGSPTVRWRRRTWPAYFPHLPSRSLRRSSIWSRIWRLRSCQCPSWVTGWATPGVGATIQSGCHRPGRPQPAPLSSSARSG